MVCVWDQKNKQLTYVRKATPEEILKMKLNFETEALTKEVNFEFMRETVLENLKQFLSDEQALLVLYSMVSEEPIFVNCHNISEQIAELMPRVCNLKVKAPFK